MNVDKKLLELHSELCKVFTNPKRLEIINILSEGEKTVNELVELTKVSQANLSQHLAVLREKKVVNARREGQNIYYSISNPKILQACTLMREVLLEQISESESLAKKVLVAATSK